MESDAAEGDADAGSEADADSAAGSGAEDDSEDGPAEEPVRDEHTAVLRVSTLTGAAASDAAGSGAGGDGGEAEDARPEPADEAEDGSDAADGAEPDDARPDAADDADESDVADDVPATDAAEDAPEDTPKDAAEEADAAADGDGTPPEDAAPVPEAPAAPGDRNTSVLRPLVSDLPAERTADPARKGPSGAQKAPTRASAPYEAPQASPTAPKPRTGPVAPPAGPDAGPTGQPSAPAKPAAGVPLPPYAGTPTAVGTPTAASPEGAVTGPDGTRSMPVPPEPGAPLKLLAELTNTPPPRQTLLRSILRRFKIWTPLVVLLAIVFVVVQALRPLPSPSMALTAAPSYTFDGTPLPQSMPWPAEGQSVAEVEGLGSLGVHGAQTPVPIASVTKVMTAYLILRDHPLTGSQNGPTIPVDAQAASEASSSDESTAQVKEGQQFTERQMLQLLLIPSGNNIARLLARWDSGTQEVFVTKMQKAARDLGMTNTTYTGASGFESSTKSTAVDQLKLAREVMKNDVFRSVVAQPNIKIPGVGTIYNNNNDLVHVGVIGIKTGSSTPAGGALMWAATKKIDGKEQLILGVVLQQHGGTTVYDSLQAALVNSQKLIESVQGGLTSSTIVKKGEVVGRIDDGLGGHTPVVAAEDLKAVGWAGMRTTLTMTPGKDGLPHSAKAGTQVGTLGFGSGSARTTVPVVLRSDLSEPSFGKKLTRLG
ncbi:D-alanyl-D-alanine carboxypeptidase [Actinacidiphila alni]|uniref:D-alanyl-D-alanine carboxypeptidase n=1 Tax=Actinacidiphila alni TaxID=380248 RepID=UPI001FE3FE82|nr:D-alanyl-D-alanine carboxypeptidase [Actinacidiphila alni]